MLEAALVVAQEVAALVVLVVAVVVVQEAEMVLERTDIHPTADQNLQCSPIFGPANHSLHCLAIASRNPYPYTCWHRYWLTNKSSSY